MKRNFSLHYIFLSTIIISSFFLGVQFLYAHNIHDEITSLQDSVSDQKDRIEQLKKDVLSYESTIREKQAESVSLENQITILDNYIKKTNVNIALKNEEIEVNREEAKATTQAINVTQKDIDEKKSTITRLINKIHQNDNVNELQMFLVEKSFSEFFDNIEHTKDLQKDIQNVLSELKHYQEDLEIDYKRLAAQNEQLIQLKALLEEEKRKQEDQKQAKEYLLAETKGSEKTFQNLYWQSKQQKSDLEQDIQSLEREIRDKIAERDRKVNPVDDTITLDSPSFMWPVSPTRGITAIFHDPEYPFRHLFEHSAVDIRAYQGTNIKAAADGYVARAADNGYGYSYILIVHGDGFSTLYGHTSRIDVKNDQYVSKGDVIGAVGGMPGTLGAGKFSTGSHLHFEVRLNGIPVDPQLYLP